MCNNIAVSKAIRGIMVELYGKNIEIYIC